MDDTLPDLPGSLPELLVAALEAGPVGEVDRAARHMDQLPVDLLKPHEWRRRQSAQRSAAMIVK